MNLDVLTVSLKDAGVVPERGDRVRHLMNGTAMGNQDFRLPAVDRAMSLFELLAESQSGLTLSRPLVSREPPWSSP